MTYDDGHFDNLDHAAPDLEERGLKGTFYLPTGNPRVHERADEWRAAFHLGHEIGNHSVVHPARADDYAPNIPHWLPPEKWLERYSPEEIAREVGEAAAWLDASVGADPLRTYAYPCCATAIGEIRDEASYDAAIRKHHFAARIGGGRSNDPNDVEMLRIRSFGFTEPSLDDLTGYCREARKTGGWTVLMFHSVEGRSHNTPREVHQRLLDHLLEEDYWVAPLNRVAAEICRQRGIDYPSS